LANKSSLSDDLTVVTAYFDLGKIHKGNGNLYYTSQLYRDWARVFARLNSPTVIFVDSEVNRRYFKELRALHVPANKTVVRQLNRQQVNNTDFS